MTWKVRALAIAFIVFTPILIGCEKTCDPCDNSDEPQDDPPDIEETVSKPSKPTGPAEIYVHEITTCCSGGSWSNLGHPVQYR